MTVADVLRSAKALLTPETWAQHDFAFNAEGELCDPADAEAVSFCALGAVRRLKPLRVHSVEAEEYLHEAAVRICPESAEQAENDDPAVWVNDHTDLETVHKMFDEAIRLAEGIS